MRFKQVDPKDNPMDEDGLTARDRELIDAGRMKDPRKQDPNDRPVAAVGVDRPHGGGDPTRDQEAAERQGDVSDRFPLPNPNNPDSANNPSSTARRDLLAQGARESSPAEVTTEPVETVNERRERIISEQKAENERKARDAKDDGESDMIA